MVIFKILAFYSFGIFLIITSILPEVPSHIKDPLRYSLQGLVNGKIDQNLGILIGLSKMNSWILFICTLFIIFIIFILSIKKIKT
jgi:hypothetical protein